MNILHNLLLITYCWLLCQACHVPVDGFRHSWRDHFFSGSQPQMLPEGSHCCDVWLAILKLSMQVASPPVLFLWRHTPTLLPLRKVCLHAGESFSPLLWHGSNWQRFVLKSSRQVGHINSLVGWSFHWPLFVEKLDLLLHQFEFKDVGWFVVCGPAIGLGDSKAMPLWSQMFFGNVVV